MSASSGVLWGIFLAGSLTVTIVVVAFVAAIVIAQRDRIAMRRERAAMVARAHEEERAWVAGELHDDVLQRVAVLRHELEAVSKTVPFAGTGASDATPLHGIIEEVRDLGVAVRNIAKRLHPTVVDQVGLLPAVQALADEVLGNGAIQVDLRLPVDLPTISGEVARAAYRIVQEGLRNAVRHSGSARATVSIEVLQQKLVVRIKDEGRGFDDRARQPNGIGLSTVRERALSVGGQTTITSGAGNGTVIEAVLPLNGRG